MQEAPLDVAMSVSGVRSMVGEAYPDPVRVVCLGCCSVQEVLASPSDSRWLEQSVEFCGGTHITDASVAGAFAILEEKAIAKGVRRIVAVTGEVAKTALAEGDALERQLSVLEASKKTDEGAVQDLSRRSKRPQCLPP